MPPNDPRWWLARHSVPHWTLLHVQERGPLKRGFCCFVDSREEAKAQLIVLRARLADIDAPRPQPQTYDPVDV